MRYQCWQWVILMVVLIPSSYSDIKKQEINPWLIAGVLPCAAMLGALFTGWEAVPEYFVRFFPGIVILFASHLTKGCIGAGDGLVCLFLGSVLPSECVILVILTAFISAALFGITMMCIGKMKAKSRLPFVPFILLGVLLCGFIQ